MPDDDKRCAQYVRGVQCHHYPLAGEERCALHSPERSVREARKAAREYRVPAYVLTDIDGKIRDLVPEAPVTSRTVEITLSIDVATSELESEETLTEGMLEKIGQDANEDFAGVFGYVGWSIRLTDRPA